MNTETHDGAWTRIGGEGGHGGPVVLAVDFDGSGRSEATFRDLAKILPSGLEVWQAVPPPDSHTPGLPAQRYTDWWLGLPGGEGTQVRAVLGYCAGSVFASALADSLESRFNERPPVVLFNPGVPTVDTLDRDFTGIVDGMTVLDEEEREALRNRARRVRADFGTDFGAVSGEYVAMYLDACGIAFERYGIDAEVGGQLTRMFLSYVNYLTAARSVGVRPGWSSASALTAREQAGSGFVDDETVFELSRAELLRSPEVARAAFGLLVAAEGVAG